jgi:hypothetical protein
MHDPGIEENRKADNVASNLALHFRRAPRAIAFLVVLPIIPAALVLAGQYFREEEAECRAPTRNGLDLQLSFVALPTGSFTIVATHAVSSNRR